MLFSQYFFFAQKNTLSSGGKALVRCHGNASAGASSVEAPLCKGRLRNTGDGSVLKHTKPSPVFPHSIEIKKNGEAVPLEPGAPESVDPGGRTSPVRSVLQNIIAVKNEINRGRKSGGCLCLRRKTVGNRVQAIVFPSEKVSGITVVLMFPGGASI